MLIRAILPEWAQVAGKPKVIEGDFNDERVKQINDSFYNTYFFVNTPSKYNNSKPISGSDIDTFTSVFVDMDLKDGVHKSKNDFLEKVKAFSLLPSMVVDSGNGIHAYWEVSDLDANSFLRLQRRLCRFFKTDEAVSKICQLMRVPNTLNHKVKNSPKACEIIAHNYTNYACEDLDKSLPVITVNDENYCQNHFNSCFSVEDKTIEINDKLPAKFGKLLAENSEIKLIWQGKTKDRSKADYRIAHLMFSHDFTKEEALSVLVNSAKAMARNPKDRYNYALNIVDKIWTYEMATSEEKPLLSRSVADILNSAGVEIKGTRFRCFSWLDNTLHGFRLGQIMGLVAGSGVGKTAVALNMFMGFVENNPDYDHFFVPLEQPVNEIADRWKTLCGSNTKLHNKVHLISNYDDEGNYRNLSLDDIQKYIMEFKEKTGLKVGCVVIDHIGALATNKTTQLVDICHKMKAFAIQTNTFLIMQSQAPREKSGIGDLELNKDAAYGTVFFESYCDYLVTLWQPLKRCYTMPNCPSVTALKFCKIRHKKQHKDVIKEDVRYTFLFDPETEKLRLMNQKEENDFDFFNNNATSQRKQDRKTDVLTYVSARTIEDGVTDGKTNHNKN